MEIRLLISCITKTITLMKKQLALIGALFLACGMGSSVVNAAPAPQVVNTNTTTVSGTVVDENGEPRVVLLDNECGNSMSFVANNFREFIEKVCRKENLIAGTHPIKDEKEAERERIKKALDDIDGNCSLCRGGIFFAIVGLLICLLFKKYILVAVCAVIVAILIPLERRFSKEYDRDKSELPELCFLSLETPRCWHWSLYC